MWGCVRSRWSGLVTTGLLAAATEASVVWAGASPVSANEGDLCAYVTNSANRTISVINVGAHQLSTTFPPDVAPFQKPTDLAMSPDGTFLYVLNRGDDFISGVIDSVSVVDTNTNRVVAAIPVGDKPTSMVADRDGRRLFVTHFKPRALSVIDVERREVIATVRLGSIPVRVILSPRGTWAYVILDRGVAVVDLTTFAVRELPLDVKRIVIGTDGTVAYANSPSGVAVIDTTRHTVVGKIDIGTSTNDVGIEPESGLLYVTSYAANAVFVIDLVTKTVVSRLALDGAEVLTLSPRGGIALVFAHNGLSVVDTRGPVIVAQLEIDDLDSAVISPDGAVAYVSNPNTDEISIVDLSTQRMAGVIPAATSPFTAPLDVAIAPDGELAYVAESTRIAIVDTATQSIVRTTAVGASDVVLIDDQLLALGAQGLHVIDPRSGEVIASIPVDTAWADIATDRAGDLAFVTQRSASAVAVVDLRTYELAPDIPLPSQPQSLVVSGDQLYVSLFTETTSRASIAVIDTATRQVIRTIPLGCSIRPGKLATSADGAFLWINLELILQPDMESSPDCSAEYPFPFLPPDLAVLDIATEEIVGGITVGGVNGCCFSRLVAAPDGAFIYALVAQYPPSAFAIDTIQRRVVSRILVGEYATGIAFGRLPGGCLVAAAPTASTTPTPTQLATPSAVPSTPPRTPTIKPVATATPVATPTLKSPMQSRDDAGCMIVRLPAGNQSAAPVLWTLAALWIWSRRKHRCGRL